MVIVARAVIGLTAIGGSFDFTGKSGCPLLPREIPLLGELDGEREGLGLPWFGKYGPAFVGRQA